MSDAENSYQKIFSEVKNLCNLEIENARLILSEKLTLLIGKITLTAVVFVMITAAMLFISMGVANLLMRVMSPTATYAIVSGFYVLLAIVAAIFRRQLIVDPIARYISRVILDPPSPSHPTDTPQHYSHLNHSDYEPKE